MQAPTSSDAPAGPEVLQARGIVKRFPGVVALDGVDFTARRGEIHALMGENGAGKSTLFKVLTGAYRADGGEVRVDGQTLRPRSPRDAEAAGISTVYQEVNLLPHLSVAENICLGRQPRRLGFIDRRAMAKRAVAALSRLGVEVDVERPLSAYSIAIQQMTAIARALDCEARILILDEPTASLDRKEAGELFRVLRHLRDTGLAIVFVSHFLEQVYAISDRITVLRNGRLIGEFAIGELPEIELIRHMTGRTPEGESRDGVAAPSSRQGVILLDDAGGIEPPPRRGRRGATRLALKQLSGPGLAAPVDMTVDAGAVTGLAGLLGSGRTEIARLIFGLSPSTSGAMELDGVPVRIANPRQALRHRLALTPEDRKAEGIVPHLSVRENLVLALQSSQGIWRRVSERQQEELAQRFISALAIKTPNSATPVGLLSGGNQQKVLLARWLCVQPRVLMLDEPTRGIDVGAKMEIEALLRKLRDEGMALVFISSELEEVARVSQCVVVLRDRKKVGELTGDEISLERIYSLIAGAPAESERRP